MRSGRTLPSPYSPLAFHTVKALSLISVAIVSGIIIYFTIHLHQDGFKLPWTFIVVGDHIRYQPSRLPSS
jgi:hypothetical protein